MILLVLQNQKTKFYNEWSGNINEWYNKINQWHITDVNATVRLKVHFLEIHQLEQP